MVWRKFATRSVARSTSKSRQGRLLGGNASGKRRVIMMTRRWFGAERSIILTVFRPVAAHDPGPRPFGVQMSSTSGLVAWRVPSTVRVPAGFPIAFGRHTGRPRWNKDQIMKVQQMALAGRPADELCQSPDQAFGTDVRSNGPVKLLGRSAIVMALVSCKIGSGSVESRNDSQRYREEMTEWG